jgi:hypothetical protein
MAPSGGVDPSKLLVIGSTGVAGKLILYRDGTFLRVFSTVTGRWHAHTPSFGTTPVLLPDILLIPEAESWTAMSAYRGVFESRPIRFAESTLTSGRSIACVRLRDQAHVFSAFTGRWHDRTVPADWRLALHERLAIFFHPALDTFGGAFMLDALTGQWHDLPATNVTLFRASVSASTVMWLFRRADQTTYLVTWSTHAPQFRFHQVQALPPLNNLGGGVGGADFVGAWDVCYSGLFDTVTRNFNVGVAGRFHLLLLGPTGVEYMVTAFGRAELVWGY